MSHPFRAPGPADVPGLGQNGQPRRQVELPPIALVGLVPPNIPPEPGLGPVEQSVTRTVLPMQDGSQMICERRATREGVHCNWYTPDSAIEAGRILIQLGRAAKSTLALPPGAQLPAIDDDAELAALAERQQADTDLAVAYGDRGPEIIEQPTDAPIPLPSRVETRETTCDRGAELHVPVADADEVDCYPCVNDEPDHEIHRATPAGRSEPIHWSYATEGNGYRTTIPPRVTDRRG